MARAPIHAAGGIVVRSGETPLIAVVQRRKDKRWVLPKGKLKSKEKPIAGAKREAIEETGHDVVVHQFIGAVSYQAGARVKIVEFWRMEAAAEPTQPLMRDIKAVAWLPLPRAIDRLSLPLEKVFLRNVGPRALTPEDFDVNPAPPMKTTGEAVALVPASETGSNLLQRIFVKS